MVSHFAGLPPPPPPSACTFFNCLHRPTPSSPCSRASPSARPSCHRYCILANKLVIRSLRSTEEASHWDPALPHMDVEQLVHFRFDGELKHTEAEAPLLEWDELVTLRDGNCRPQIMAAWIQGFIAHLSHELRHDPKAGEELLQDWCVCVVPRPLLH